MNNSEQIIIVFKEFLALEKIIYELKEEIEQLKYVNRELRYKLPDFQSENKK